ncbi:Endonuclease, Uma2 family (restriction endonuclease fold) [Granulicella rosea]|uniref:Endonuclease, Uma2 family (Restriction endonuclease fold) n=1 Tax=Granulicella rosea TaxID=474952 RepID=A0A239DG37_9BACT|nr:Uma2 family endonuclease [Granulicella rosea]SNS30982.1 Endonuclease, Uma2 family (restriction endonuclease fold) [Granulicella rosea]
MSLNLTSLVPPISLRPSATLTDDELMRFSADNKPYKIERDRNGEITIMTPVGFTGGTHELYVASELLQWAERDGRGVAAGPNAGFSLPDGSCLAPDAAWVARSRLDLLSAEEQAGFLPLCPEFIIEVRSRTDPRRLLEAKMQLWLDNGAELAWLVDPIDGNISVYSAGSAVRTFDRPDVVKGTGSVAGFELHCTRLWSKR